MGLVAGGKSGLSHHTLVVVYVKRKNGTVEPGFVLFMMPRFVDDQPIAIHL
jgi:hypothetical protein